MIIQHNMLANNTNRQLKITTGDTADAVEKLSSGYRINRAADDAAGLAISEKMRGQIRGLDQGALNVQDGQNFCNVADGAMQEMENIIHRMRELAVQAANDTYTTEDRWDMQFEIEQLQAEIDRMSKETEFNTIKVFTEGETGTLSPDQAHQRVYALKGNNYGVTEVVGVPKVWSGQYMTDALTLNTPDWHSSGNDYSWQIQVDYVNNPSANQDYIGDRAALDTAANSFLGSHGITLPTSPTQDSYTLISSDGKTEATVVYVRDVNGDPLITTLGCASYDKPATDPSRQPVETFFAGNQFHAGTNGKGWADFSNTTRPPVFGSAWVDFSGLGTDYQTSDLYDQGVTTVCGHGCGKYYSIYFTGDPCATTQGSVNYTAITAGSNPRLELNISGVTTGQELVEKIMEAISYFPGITSHWNQYAYSDNEPAKLYIYDNWAGYMSDIFEPVAREADGSSDIINAILSPAGKRTGSLWIQSGANSEEGLFLNRPWVSLNRLGLSTYSVLSTDKAEKAITSADTALQHLNEERARIGAMYNCLDHSYANDTNTSENLQSAESKIRDANLADEMVRFAKDSILMQAGQAMLAQANQTTQGIVQLLGK